jgi:hypothetical protein
MDSHSFVVGQVVHKDGEYSGAGDTAVVIIVDLGLGFDQLYR